MALRTPWTLRTGENSDGVQGKVWDEHAAKADSGDVDVKMQMDWEILGGRRHTNLSPIGPRATIANISDMRLPSSSTKLACYRETQHACATS